MTGHCHPDNATLVACAQELDKDGRQRICAVVGKEQAG